jgi:hypothetical protein
MNQIITVDKNEVYCKRLQRLFQLIELSYKIRIAERITKPKSKKCISK